MDLFQNEEQAFEWLREFKGFESLNENELKIALDVIVQFSELGITLIKK